MKLNIELNRSSIFWIRKGGNFPPANFLSLFFLFPLSFFSSLSLFSLPWAGAAFLLPFPPQPTNLGRLLPFSPPEHPPPPLLFLFLPPPPSAPPLSSCSRPCSSPARRAPRGSRLLPAASCCSPRPDPGPPLARHASPSRARRPPAVHRRTRAPSGAPGPPPPRSTARVPGPLLLPFKTPARPSSSPFPRALSPPRFPLSLSRRRRRLPPPLAAGAARPPPPSPRWTSPAPPPSFGAIAEDRGATEPANRDIPEPPAIAGLPRAPPAAKVFKGSNPIPCEILCTVPLVSPARSRALGPAFDSPQTLARAPAPDFSCADTCPPSLSLPPFCRAD